MNKILYYLIITLGLFFLSGCEQTTNKDKIAIETQDITTKA